MPPLYPLRFRPLLRRFLWGGRRLESLGKTLPPGDDYAESWEVVDRRDDQSIVAAGSLAGRTLHEVISQYGGQLFGRHAPLEQFPLLFKFLDAHDKLSIQVHPDDARGARLTPPDRGKTEAWVIVEAEPGSHLWAGLKRGFDRAALEREVARDTAALCIERHEPRVGDCYFLPAGVVHALGPGLVVAEIQQASDTTYRLHDWNRTGPDGQPRALHIDAALEAIDYQHGPVAPQVPQSTNDATTERLVTCEHFILDRHQVAGTKTIGGDDRFHLLAVLAGELKIDGNPDPTPLARGGVALLPASLGEVSVTAKGSAIVLEAYLP